MAFLHEDGYGYAIGVDGFEYFVHYTFFATKNGGDLVPGRTIFGTIGPNPQMIGQWRLTDVVGAIRASEDAPWTRQWVICRVTKWVRSGGFGLLEAEIKTDPLLKRPAFVHASAFGGGNLQVGRLRQYPSSLRP